MADEGIFIAGKEYPDEESFVVATHPWIPDDIKRLYVTPSTPDEKKSDVVAPPPTADQNVLTPKGLMGNQQLQEDPDAETPIAYKPQTLDYDYDAWKAANPNVEMAPGQHYPDTFKLPNHMTFSDESQYHDGVTNQGGHWGTEDGKDTFTPGPTNLQMHTPEELQEYFKRVEPDVILKMPAGGPTEPAGALKPPAGTYPTLSFLGAGRALNQGIDSVIDTVAHPVEAVKGLVDNVRKAMMLPGDVAAGLVPDDQLVGRAAELAGLMVGGPSPFAGKIADGTLGSFAGVKSARRMNMTNDLGHAQVLEAEGAHPDKILSDSGWFRGYDNRWRYEIADDKATYKPEWFNKTAPEKTVQQSESEIGDMFKQEPFDPYVGHAQTTLGKILDHPDLYKAYPDLKNVPVIRDDRVPTAHWDGTSIVVGGDAFNTKSTILHEVQHAIQDREGFARGAAPGKAGTSYTLKYAQNAKDQIVEPLKALYAKLSKPGAIITKQETEYLSDLQYAAKRYNEYVKAGDEKAYDLYMKSAGETEARNTEARMLLNDEERRSMHPVYTADESNTIVRMEPTLATPYGYKGSKGIEPAAPEKPTVFRRAANDNQSPADWAKDFKSDLPKYNPDIADHNAYLKMKLDDLNNRSFELLSKPAKERTEFEAAQVKKYDAERKDLLTRWVGDVKNNDTPFLDALMKETPPPVYTDIADYLKSIGKPFGDNLTELQQAKFNQLKKKLEDHLKKQ